MKGELFSSSDRLSSEHISSLEGDARVRVTILYGYDGYEGDGVYPAIYTSDRGGEDISFLILIT